MRAIELTHCRPELFKGKRVVVVGLGNTGADTAAALCGHAEKVYASHKHGAIVVSRHRYLTFKTQPDLRSSSLESLMGYRSITP